jgi:hypothetical protein
MSENVASEQVQQSKDTNIINKSLGFFRDPQGDFSSGRLIKVGAFFAAILLAGFLCVKLFTTTKDNPADLNIVNAISWTIGSFLVVATGSEALQKLTKT